MQLIIAELNQAILIEETVVTNWSFDLCSVL